LTNCIIPWTFYIGVALNLLFSQCNDLGNNYYFTRSEKFSPKKKKGFRDGPSHSTRQKVKKQGEMA